MINVLEDVPQLVRFSSAARHDHTFLGDLKLTEGSFVVFDKGYTDYAQYHQWTQENVFFVTRQKDNAGYRQNTFRIQIGVLNRSVKKGCEKGVWNWLNIISIR